MNQNKKISLLIEKIGSQVYYGPFSGLRIPNALINELTLPEILGLYESCLFKVWEKLISKKINNIMMIGGHMGYYSAALSYLFQPDRMVVFEREISLHALILEWAKVNEINSLQLFEEATASTFKNWENEINLIVCDCEGEEIDLLNPLEFEWQKKCDIVVEVHPFYQKNLAGTLVRRFIKTHKISIINDDFEEDEKIKKILRGLQLEKLKYDEHPNHRWIISEGKKVHTSGYFLFLESLN